MSSDIPPAYGKEPGLELRTGSCSHDAPHNLRELRRETRVVCGRCRSVLPRRFGFSPSGREQREAVEQAAAERVRRAERDALRARRAAEKSAQAARLQAVREAFSVPPLVRTPEAPKGRYAPASL